MASLMPVANGFSPSASLATDGMCRHVLGTGGHPCDARISAPVTSHATATSIADAAPSPFLSTLHGYVEELTGDGVDSLHSDMAAHLAASVVQQGDASAGTGATSTPSGGGTGQAGYRGVSLQPTAPEAKKWRVLINHHGRQLDVGSYGSELQAARAYDEAARRLHGDRARLNFPDTGKGERCASGRSTFRGISWQGKCAKWEVRIKHEGKMRYVGVYSDENVAAAAWDIEAMRLRGNTFRNLNFPDYHSAYQAVLQQGLPSGEAAYVVLGKAVPEGAHGVGMVPRLQLEESAQASPPHAAGTMLSGPVQPSDTVLAPFSITPTEIASVTTRSAAARYSKQVSSDLQGKRRMSGPRHGLKRDYAALLHASQGSHEHMEALAHGTAGSKKRSSREERSTASPAGSMSGMSFSLAHRPSILHGSTESLPAQHASSSPASSLMLDGRTEGSSGTGKNSEPGDRQGDEPRSAVGLPAIGFSLSCDFQSPSARLPFLTAFRSPTAEWGNNQQQSIGTTHQQSLLDSASGTPTGLGFLCAPVTHSEGGTGADTAAAGERYSHWPFGAYPSLASGQETDGTF